MGVAGTLGTALMLITKVAGDVQGTDGFVQVKENAVPGVNPVIAAMVPTPDCVNPAGTEFTVQPVDGKPDKNTTPY